MSHYDKEKSDKSQSKSSDHDKAPSPLIVWKERGETLAVLLERLRSTGILTIDEKVTYAGRLDPMASGIVMILRENERYKKDAYLSLTKSYTVSILLGIATDTYDPLGLINKISFGHVSEEKIKNAIHEIKSIKRLPYPMYSSRTVKGKTLFHYARTNTDVVVPKKEVEIFESKLITVERIPLVMIAQKAIVEIQKVVGDFRQSESIASWRKILEEHPHQAVQLITVSIVASSGTYMRSLAVWMGKELGLPALAYKIIRTKLGHYT